MLAALAVPQWREQAGRRDLASGLVLAEALPHRHQRRGSRVRTREHWRSEGFCPPPRRLEHGDVSDGVHRDRPARRRPVRPAPPQPGPGTRSYPAGPVHCGIAKTDDRPGQDNPTGAKIRVRRTLSCGAVHTHRAGHPFGPWLQYPPGFPRPTGTAVGGGSRGRWLLGSA